MKKITTDALINYKGHMTQTPEAIEYTLPDYLACYLINGDIDSITVDEKKEIDEYLKRQEVFIVGVNDDSSFRWGNDLNNIGASCSTFIAHKKDYNDNFIK